MHLKKHIPNIITSFNLFFGCQAIIVALNNDLQQAGIFIAIAAILDFFDGFAARILNVKSEIGKQLDSLADMVSFGVAPGIIFYIISQEHLVFTSNFMQHVAIVFICSYLAFLIPIFSAIRLAKFNLDIRQSDSFIGVPTPANTMFIAIIPFIISNNTWGMAPFFTSNIFLIVFPFISSYLMVAELPLFALKFKSFKWNGNKIRYIFLIICILLLAIFSYLGVILGLIFYILLSIIQNKITPNEI